MTVFMASVPRRARQAEIDRPAPIALAGTAFSFDNRSISMQFADAASVEQPGEPKMVDAGERPFAIAAEQIERSPTQGRGALCPTIVEEPAAVIDKLQPMFWRNVGWRAGRIKPRQRLGPGAGRATVVLDDGGPLIMSIRPGFGRWFGIVILREAPC
jgi:hypothetical protein